MAASPEAVYRPDDLNVQFVFWTCFGSHPGYSTFHTSFVLKEAITECKSSHSIAFLALFNVKKAFDTVWHQQSIFLTSSDGCCR